VIGILDIRHPRHLRQTKSDDSDVICHFFMKYSEICVLVLKLTINVCLPQQKFPELQEQATVYTIFKICLHSGNYILILILCPMYGHLNCLLLLLLLPLGVLNLQCGSLQPPFHEN